MKVVFFGRLQDAAGAREATATLPSDIRDTEALREWLGRTTPELRDSSVRIAVNDELVAGAAPVSDTDEVAFLPPVSGG